MRRQKLATMVMAVALLLPCLGAVSVYAGPVSSATDIGPLEPLASDGPLDPGTTEEDGAGRTALEHNVISVLDTTAPVPDPGPDRAEDQNTVVLLDGSASSDNVGIVRYEWTFVHDIEGVTLEGVTASYTFTRPGVIDVTLRVWDAADNSAASTFELTIRDTEAPIAGMDIGSTLIVKGETAGWNAIGSTDNVGIVKYTWTFEYDGRTVSLDGPAPTFEFEVAGEYEVTLTVEDAAGNTDSETFTLTVESHAWKWALLVIVLVCVAWVLSVLMRMRAGTKAAGKRDRED